MGQVRVTWVQDRQFVAVDSTKHSVVLSTHDPNNGTGMKPAELLLIALGGCAAVDVIGILEKKRLKLTGCDIFITGEQDPDPPWAFRRIHIEYVIRGKNIPERAVAQAIQLSEEKYCSVHATISGVAEISHSFRIVEDA